MQKTGALLAAYSVLVCVFVVPAMSAAISHAVAVGGLAGLTGGMLLTRRQHVGLGVALVGMLALFLVGCVLLITFAAAAYANPSLEGPGGRGTPILPLAKFVVGQLLFTVPSGALLVALLRGRYKGQAQAA